MGTCLTMVASKQGKITPWPGVAQLASYRRSFCPVNATITLRAGINRIFFRGDSFVQVLNAN